MHVYALYRNSRLVLISIMALWLSIVAIGCMRALLVPCLRVRLIRWQKWAVFTSNVASSSSTDVMPSGQLTGNVGCPSGSYFSSEQWVFSLYVHNLRLIFCRGMCMSPHSIFRNTVSDVSPVICTSTHTYSYSNCMGRTATLWPCYLLTYHHSVAANAERRDPGYNRYPAARRYVHWHCPSSAIYTYKLLGSVLCVHLRLFLWTESTLLMRRHPCRVMCGVNIANVAVLLVSYLVAYSSRS